MNKENAHLYLPFVIALSEGKAIQYHNIDGKFYDIRNEVSFGFSVDKYRIKPELMAIFAIANSDKTDILSEIFKTKEDAEECIVKYGHEHYKTIVHLKEVEL